nr:hypothetical protein [uncultured Albidiferax sp.]
MTKKTNELVGGAAETGADTNNLETGLPAGLGQPSAVTTTALEQPKAGGSYLRQSDGSLVPNPDAATADEAKEPGSHFDPKPQGDSEAAA